MSTTTSPVSGNVFAGRPGAEFLSKYECQMLEQAGYGGRMGLGQNPALIVVDATWAFCGENGSEDHLAMVERFPHGCGPAAWDAIPRIRLLVDSARARTVPIIFTHKEIPSQSTDGRWEDKNSRQREDQSSAHKIVPATGYRANDLTIAKQAPSAFHGTSLLRTLVGLGIDSIIAAGTTTSGCVRATVVDAFSYNFKVSVPFDGTFDRISASHRMSLLDMDLKYADVLSADRLAKELTNAAPRS